MRIRRTLTTLTVAAMLIAGCGHHPDEAACKHAMQAQLAQGLANPTGPAATKPKACEGLDDATLQRLATEVLSGQ
jgi:hypothetical protein